MSGAPIYLDHNATTPLDPAARAAMAPWLGERFGNASSIHSFGRAARAAVEEARDRVARLLGADALDLVFCASGSEGNNAVLRALDHGEDGGHLVLSALEHPSIAECAAALARRRFAVTVVPPERGGSLDPGRVENALRPDTRLVAVQLANNELGTLQPVAEIARRCRSRGVGVLCDAVQAAGKVPVAVAELGVDYLTIAAHKFGGPLGAAALWLRPGAAFLPWLLGGAQERRRRASTENVAALAGFGGVAARAAEHLAERAAHLLRLRTLLEAALVRLPEVAIHCTASPRLPNTTHAAFFGVDANELLIRLDLAGCAVSTGSACASGKVETSPVLRALGMPAEEARSSLRISVGTSTEDNEIARFLVILGRELAELRAASSAHRAAAPAGAAGVRGSP